MGTPSYMTDGKKDAQYGNGNRVTRLQIDRKKVSPECGRKSMTHMLFVCGREQDWSAVEKARTTILRSACGSVKLLSPLQAQVRERYPHYLFVEDGDEQSNESTSRTKYKTAGKSPLM